nr:MAG TPA: hypothetical protein [Caudoviricetes sp.]
MFELLSLIFVFVPVRVIALLNLRHTIQSLSFCNFIFTQKKPLNTT